MGKLYCEVCGSNENLVPSPVPTAENLEMTMCQRCKGEHDTAHAQIEEYNPETDGPIEGELPTCTCCPGTGYRDPGCDVHSGTDDLDR